MGKEREGVAERKASRKEQKTQAAVIDMVFDGDTRGAARRHFHNHAWPFAISESFPSIIPENS
jgi:hypothetical protein